MGDDLQTYVCGYVQKSATSGQVAHVRVKDPTSKHNGQVMQVSSTCDGKTHWLDQGLHVQFQIGYKEGPPPRKKKIPYAVKVRLAD
ncbi:MAG: hypothetical protein PHR51_02640 [Patescibacteria group bacterium]|nr:hypothetical protein [Patescibacteria group bacterium]